ncbi:MAG: MurR/RpiR family transcriptional regulator [Rhodobacteraceae bacterium]|nr:MurR/RpiR family transcriptional regulator [Paracoccaceae bacterium]
MVKEDELATIEDRIHAYLPEATRADQQIAEALLDDYPAAGLSSIKALADRASVSSPSVVRFTQKLGFDGYAHFQTTLREELSQKVSTPLIRQDVRPNGVHDEHIATRYTNAAVENMQRTMQALDLDIFDTVAERLSDIDHSLMIAGGNISFTMANYLAIQMERLRPGVSSVGRDPSGWPPCLASAKPGDVLIIFDIRRYDNALMKLAELAAERDIEAILITDQWGSPVSKYASHRINCRIKAPSAWDSCISIMLVVEALTAAVGALMWGHSQPRMQDLEQMYDELNLFKRFT